MLIAETYYGNILKDTLNKAHKEIDLIGIYDKDKKSIFIVKNILNDKKTFSSDELEEFIELEKNQKYSTLDYKNIIDFNAYNDIEDTIKKNKKDPFKEFMDSFEDSKREIVDVLRNKINDVDAKSKFEGNHVKAKLEILALEMAFGVYERYGLNTKKSTKRYHKLIEELRK